MTPTPSARSQNHLRLSIAQAHQQAENHPLMKCLLSSAVTPVLYRDYLTALLPLYQAMELSLNNSSAPVCRVFDHAELRRAEAITADLKWLNQRGSLPPARATGLALPEALQTEDPLSLAAMAYLRYLGDLAGGQTLWRHLTEKLPMLNPGGLCFYEFDLPACQTVGKYLGQLRRTLLQVLEAEMALDAFVEAANRGFAWHLSLFDDVWQGGSMNVDSQVLGLSEPHRDE